MKNGNKGVLKAGPSKDKIIGANLQNNKEVIVIEPPPTAPTIRKWTGKTHGTQGGTRTFVNLTLSSLKDGEIPRSPQAGDTVSVTVDGVRISPDPTIPVGPPPQFLDGNYTVGCDGNNGNDYKWLESDGNGGVDLEDTNNSAPSWTFTAVPFSEGNCYTIYSEGNGYLNWENDGSGTDVSLADSTGPGTTWQISGSYLLAISDDPNNQPNYPYLNGNTSNGDVNMNQNPDSHNGTSWTLTTAARAVRA